MKIIKEYCGCKFIKFGDDGFFDMQIKWCKTHKEGKKLRELLDTFQKRNMNYIFVTPIKFNFQKK